MGKAERRLKERNERRMRDEGIRRNEKGGRIMHGSLKNILLLTVGQLKGEELGVEGYRITISGM